jgi:hypothetical protein
MKSGDLPGLQIEMKPDQFIDKLSPTDRTNMTLPTDSLIKRLSGQGMHGAIIGVGGVLTKPAPRKDIDCVVMLHIPRSDGTDFDKAVRCLDLLASSVRKDMESSSNRFQIKAVLPPTLDRDYGQEFGILTDAGVIQIQPQDGTPIDLIPGYDENLVEYLKTETKPFTVLARF